MKIEDFKGKRVTVMGIGLHGGGLGVINFFYQAGAKILATDLRTRRELRESLDALRNFHGVRYVLGQHREEDFKNADLIIKNPAVLNESKFLKTAKKAGVPIETDIGIFFELCPAPIIGVTGSRGKSTTASLIYQFLKPKHPDTILAGNIRMSVLEKLQEIQKTTLVVLELSSWQLNGLASHKKSPQVGAITNIMHDHLDTYKSMEEYILDKKVIYQFQKSNNFLVLNYDDEILKNLAPEAKSKIYYYSTNDRTIGELEKLPKTSQESRVGAYLGGESIFFGAAKEKIAEVSDIKLIGRHNISNVLAAVTVAKLFNVPARTIKKTLNEFGGLSGRIELIKELNGVKYINDTASTIPEAAIAAISGLSSHHCLEPKRIILITGGADKNLDFRDFAAILAKQTKAVLMLPGTATQKIENQIKKAIFNKKFKLPIKRFPGIEKTVSFAAKIAKPGDIVLLSPGCASFGVFRNQYERGEKFNQAVNKL